MSLRPDTAAWIEGLGRRELRPGTWTLEVIEELLRALGDPHLAFPALHVAGTRGKGSTCALAEAAVREAGMRTGMTTSPHLLSPCERIRVGGAPVGGQAFLELVDRVRSAGAERLQAGYFEVITAAAFLAFAEATVDLAVVETGLGGRVDATNVVRPLVTVVTRLGMDHADRLGGTRAAIASEKAGILKPGVRAVLGPNLPEAAEVVRARAAAIGAPLREVGEDDRDRAPATSLPGEAQRENAAVALVALEELGLADPRLACGGDAIRAGFAGVRWPARLQLLRGAVHGADLLLDVAHDVDGVRALVRHLGDRRPAAAIFTCLADKDLDGIAAELGGAFAGAAVVVPELELPRARPASSVAAALSARGLRASASGSVAQAVQELRRHARAGGLVVAFGSFHVAAEVLLALGGPDPFSGQDLAIPR